MHHLRHWLIALALVCAAVAICYLWLDQPIALWVHDHRIGLHSRQLLGPLTHIPDPLIPVGAATFFLLGLRALAGPPFHKIYDVIAVCGFSVVMGETVKDGLKWAFGRPWPETWKHGNSSFIRNHDYAFHWLAGGGQYNAFPSGHMTAAMAVLSVVWLCYPRLRPLCVLGALLVAAALVGSNFHFLGDVIAGAFLGATVGWMTVVLYDRAPDHPLIPGKR
jgi:membrane-associated phospholipid phosphatase